MTAVAFDTLKLARTLRDKATLSQDQAEGFAEAISEAVQGDLTTRADLKSSEAALRPDIKAVEKGLRADIAAVETGLRADIAAVETNLRAELAAFRADNNVFAHDLRATEANLRFELKAQISETRAEVIKWMVGAVGLQTVAVVGAMITLVRILKP
ncbi:MULTISPECIES: DUF1640 domain-containing protein [Methylobacterium]|uniref:DUF1640 domain-containing protein n=1 Tax=Methylobacterium TaxID=407 RepID=UPI0013EE384A|nr:DUF1640 domain-containing protein [Methylobacterium sp. DB0501]NGM35863.1 DUF1640 domain-containing protein [Methylobacterium sp. DB0501]